jgi:hypothetical protein
VPSREWFEALWGPIKEQGQEFEIGGRMVSLLRTISQSTFKLPMTLLTRRVTRSAPGLYSGPHGVHPEMGERRSSAVSADSASHNEQAFRDPQL